MSWYRLQGDLNVRSCRAPTSIFSMSVSPEPELIVVDTPPDSPVGQETSSVTPYACPDTVNPSPQKRIRKPSTQLRKKRRVSHTPDIDRGSPTLTIDNVETYRSTVFLEGGGSEANTVLQAGVEDIEPLVTSDPDAAYSAAVMEERAGFYPITRTLFVVQGWDRKRLSIVVSFLLILRGVD